MSTQIRTLETGLMPTGIGSGMEKAAMAASTATMGAVAESKRRWKGSCSDALHCRKRDEALDRCSEGAHSAARSGLLYVSHVEGCSVGVAIDRKDVYDGTALEKAAAAPKRCRILLEALASAYGCLATVSEASLSRAALQGGKCNTCLDGRSTSTSLSAMSCLLHFDATHYGI